MNTTGTSVRNIRTLVQLAVSVVLLSACLDTMGPLAQQGTLWISLSPASTMTVVPNVDMTPASYEVTGAGPDGHRFTTASVDQHIIIENLAFGIWTVTVTALNDLGVAVGRATAEAQVFTAEITPISVTIAPVTGLGAIAVSLGWCGETVQSPQIEALLAHSSGDQTSLTFSLAGDSADYARSDLESGYYTLTVRLLSNGLVVTGVVETIRVVAGQVTSFDYLFDLINRVTEELVIASASFTLAWDPPLDDGTVSSYNVYVRAWTYDEWELLANVAATETPSILIDTNLLPYSRYEFAVSAVNGSSESDMHRSTDVSALPSSGWYLNWTGP